MASQLRVRLLAAARDLDQLSLAKKAKVSRTSVAAVWQGERAVRPATLAAIAGALDVPVEALEDDVRAFRELAKIAGLGAVTLREEAGASEVLDLLAKVPKSRREPTLDAIRALLAAVQAE